MIDKNKVDLFLDVNLGVFGQIRPTQFVGAAREGKTKEAISIILKEYSFPVLNVTYSASGRLFVKDHNDLKVSTRLEELEARVRIDGAEKDVVVLGVYPMETTVSKPDQPPIQIQPDVPGLISSIGALVPAVAPFAGVLSGLGLTFGPLIKPRFHILDKAFLADRTEFGWYRMSHEDTQQEGPHLGMAFLMVHKAAKRLSVSATLSTDWEGGKVDNQVITIVKELTLVHPDQPKTPDLYDLSDVRELPITLSRAEIQNLLGVSGFELDDLLARGILKAFGSGDSMRITKGSVISALGLENESDCA